MKISLPVEFLNIYYLFQNFVVAINYLLIFGFVFFTFFLFLLGSLTQEEFVRFVLFDILIFTAIIFYFIITVISIKATNNLRQNLPLTKIQKFSSIVFPIVAIPLFVFFLLAILYGLFNFTFGV